MLADTNSGLDNACFDPVETTFYSKNFLKWTKVLTSMKKVQQVRKMKRMDKEEDRIDQYNLAVEK